MMCVEIVGRGTVSIFEVKISPIDAEKLIGNVWTLEGPQSRSLK